MGNVTTGQGIANDGVFAPDTSSCHVTILCTSFWCATDAAFRLFLQNAHAICHLLAPMAGSPSGTGAISSGDVLDTGHNTAGENCGELEGDDDPTMELATYLQLGARSQVL